MEEQVKKDDDEISLIDLFSVIWLRKTLIITITAVAFAGIITFSIISKKLPAEKSPLPDMYEPKALLMINNSNSNGGGGLSSLLGGDSSGGSGLSSLASLAGVNIGGATNTKLAVFLVQSDLFLDTIVEEFDLARRYKIKKFFRTGARKKLKKLLTAEEDKDSSVIAISFLDIDPFFATDVVNFAVRLLEQRFDEMGLDRNKREKENLEINLANSLQEIKNLQLQAQTFSHTGMTAGAAALEAARLQIELQSQQQVYSQLKVQHELVKVTIASQMPIFQIVETARVPDQKSKPSRSILCIIVTFAAGFFATFLAFMQNAIENIKKDPVAMAKLRAGTDYSRDTGRRRS
ncbi:MAG: lipopolysaccharide biosynthesis protein [Spirochaetaceae bacterium]|jgi:uncharacterized protein involved in exopolysaccharide biosynthesis|nr:lipopolysaccharide biosynthesis protein [Spirochaetaceae bacterium]